MYSLFFGLKHEPFSIAPDPRYLFMSERHREALAHLLYGVNGGGGFVLLTGEIGAGKTTVCRCFLEQIPRRCNVAYIFNPKLTVVELLMSVCEEFGIRQPQLSGTSATVKEYLDPLNEFLLRTHAVGQNNVLVIDEAQMLSADVLEQLRLLTNLETNERKLLQIILIGQPELRDMLARPELEQLAQRVIARYHLGALSEAETEQYIRHRLVVAGMTIAMPFDAKAMQRIHRLSRGVPRRINLLCDRALLGAYAQGKGQVDRDIVDKAASEVFDKHGNVANGSKLGKTGRLALAGVAGAAIVGAAFAAGVMLMNDGVLVPSLSASRAAGKTPLAAASGSANAAPGALSSAASGASSGVASGGKTAQAGSSSFAWSGASSTGAASAPIFITAAELKSRFQPLNRDEKEAWRALAKAWKVTLDDGDPCGVAPRSQLQCFRNPASTLALIRQLDRPGILMLRDETDRPVYALLTGLTNQAATLRIGDTTQTVTLVSLATLWRGDFATFWRLPTGHSGRLVDSGSGAMTTWVSTQLDSLQAGGAASGAAGRSASASAGASAGAGASAAPNDAIWRSRVSAFQLSQGLKPDGLAGPTTFMQLNRATGVDEPRLRADQPAS